ncbi:MAG TPA: WYL domain-containing protein [Symbiobacteriaceae bacterium]|jgi:predicted DNA-binding transcriptional regulator YafY
MAKADTMLSIFQPDELVALFQAALLAGGADLPHAEALRTALAKIRQTLAPTQAEELERNTAGLPPAGRTRGGPAEPWLATLEEAVADGATLHIRYRKPESDEPEDRLVDPYGLIYRAGLWYLIGHCHLRRALREFRVDRILSAQRSGATFQPRADLKLTGRYADDWLRNQRTQHP